MTSKIKEALFYVFGTNHLPQIKTNSTPTEIHEWKNSRHVRKCYEILFDVINPISEPNVSFMSKILERIWTNSERAPRIHLAYAIGVCTTLLNPNNNSIHISRSNIKSKTDRYLVSFASLYGNEIFKLN